MLAPWFLLLLLISLTLAFAYQLTSRKFGWRVIGYWIVLFAAVLFCEALAESANLNVTRLGDLRLLPDLAGAVVVIGGMHLLRV